MYLPNKLYKTLPYFYVVAGLLAVYFGENPVGQGSGFLLIFTAFLIWKLRKEPGN
jgi:hypothetical protein